MWHKKVKISEGKREKIMRKVTVYTVQGTAVVQLLFIWLLIILPFIPFVLRIYLLHAWKLWAQQVFLCYLFVSVYKTSLDGSL